MRVRPILFETLLEAVWRVHRVKLTNDKVHSYILKLQEANGDIDKCYVRYWSPSVELELPRP